MVFGEVIEFVIVDAPFECIEECPKALRRFLAPGRDKMYSWLKFSNWQTGTSDAPDVVTGMEEVTDYLIDILKTEGPFDGVLAFS